MSYFIISWNMGNLKWYPSLITWELIPFPNLLKMIARSPGFTLYMNDEAVEAISNVVPRASSLLAEGMVFIYRVKVYLGARYSGKGLPDFVN